MAADAPVVMEDVRMIFKNFSGRPSQFNEEGERNFAILLDEGTAEAMAADGWNVKTLKPRDDADEGEPNQPFLPIKVEYRKGTPPRVVQITERGRLNLSEGEVMVLDWVDIKNCDIMFRPYPWDINGKQGITAYLQSMYVTIDEDPLEKKYADLERQ